MPLPCGAQLDLVSSLFDFQIPPVEPSPTVLAEDLSGFAIVLQGFTKAAQLAQGIATEVQDQGVHTQSCPHTQANFDVSRCTKAQEPRSSKSSPQQCKPSSSDTGLERQMSMALV